jgi:hypothetical protein
MVGQTHRARLELVDADGGLVAMPGGQPLVIESEVKVTLTGPHSVGVPVTMPFAVNFGPTPIPVGRHTFRFVVGREVVSTSFEVHE